MANMNAQLKKEIGDLEQRVGSRDTLNDLHRVKMLRATSESAALREEVAVLRAQVDDRQSLISMLRRELEQGKVVAQTKIKEMRKSKKQLLKARIDEGSALSRAQARLAAALEELDKIRGGAMESKQRNYQLEMRIAILERERKEREKYVQTMIEQNARTLGGTQLRRGGRGARSGNDRGERDSTFASAKGLKGRAKLKFWQRAQREFALDLAPAAPTAGLGGDAAVATGGSIGVSGGGEAGTVNGGRDFGSTWSFSASTPNSDASSAVVDSRSPRKNLPALQHAEGVAAAAHHLGMRSTDFIRKWRELVTRLKRAETTSAERLHEIVGLKQQLANFREELGTLRREHRQLVVQRGHALASGHGRRGQSSTPPSSLLRNRLFLSRPD